MTRRGVKRLLAVLAGPLLFLFVSLGYTLGFEAPASAHDVTSITADCTYVTVHFANFPDVGVMVHISAHVEGQAALSTDVLVTASTTEAQLDIGAETATLFGATGTVDVHVSWTLNGDQHVHQTLTVTCGSSTTTTQASTTTIGGETTTTTVAGGTTTTTVGGESTTTTMSGGTTTVPATTTTMSGATTTTMSNTSTTPATGGTTSTTISSAIAGGSGTPAGGIGTSSNVSGESAFGANAGVSGESTFSSGTTPITNLPFTGDSSGAFGVAGLTLVTVGAAAAAVARRRSGRA